MGIIELRCLQILSLTEWFFIQISIIYDNIPVGECQDAEEYTKIVFQ